MNVPEQNMPSSYASGEIPSAKDNGRPKGDVIEKRSFPKRGTKCREEKNDFTAFFTVSRLLVTGDTPTATSVCGFRHADGISPDAQPDSTMLCPVTLTVLNQQDRFVRRIFSQHYDQI